MVKNKIKCCIKKIKQHTYDILNNLKIKFVYEDLTDTLNSTTKRKGNIYNNLVIDIFL